MAFRSAAQYASGPSTGARQFLDLARAVEPRVRASRHRDRENRRILIARIAIVIAEIAAS
ncbi:hypothetical protein L6V77_15455 [Myxococcota bacterium]|nr:hypothetical protein [Myxococcota bacterium]